jgi:hypothetical protein
MQNYVLAAQNAVDSTRVARVSSTLSLFRSLAGALGVAGLGALALAVAGPEPDAASHAHGTAAVFAASGVAALISLVASVLIGRQQLRETVRA